MSTGVYAIENIITRDLYIGSTGVSFGERWSKHCRQLRRGKHGNPRLQAAWNEHGPAAFVFKIVEVCEPGACVSAEQRHMDELQPSYNINKFADSSRGRRASAETRAKMSAVHSSPSNPLRGRPRSDEVKRKCREAQLGVKSHMYGKKQSEETKQKISKANTGRKRSAEFCKRISEIKKEQFRLKRLANGNN